MGTVNFIGITFDSVTFDDAVRCTSQLAKQDRFAYLVTPNVDHAIQLSRYDGDGAFHAAYTKAAMILCDSRILGALARRCGIVLSIVPGSDLTRELFTRTLTAGDRVVIVGGDEEMLAAVRALFPGPEFHQHIPPMGFIRDANARDAAATFVENTRAHYTFFAVGSPQSEVLAAQIADRGRATGVGLCIGASIEFITGVKQRAPRWMQRMSLEWLFRLISEPRRLWRRYLVEGPAIFAIVLRWKMTGKGV